ncbi:MAG: hypothetical protein M1814_004843 [Vezdaea aestivalis]|nr:MAG: hypothetical protein M1814_004843 [Vezdaea aestivalis]
MGDINHWRRNISNFASGRLPPPSSTSDSSQLSVPGSEGELALSPTQGHPNLNNFQSSSRNATVRLPGRTAHSSREQPRRNSASGQSWYEVFSTEWPGYNGLEQTPSADPWRMAETVLTRLMSQPLQDPLPPKYNSRMLHVLEAYRDQRQIISQLEEELASEVQARQEDSAAFKKAGRAWERESEQWQAEVKRLEVLIANGQTGMEGVMHARAGSIVRRQTKVEDRGAQDVLPPVRARSTKDVFSGLAPGVGESGDASARLDAKASQLLASASGFGYASRLQQSGRVYSKKSDIDGPPKWFTPTENNVLRVRAQSEDQKSFRVHKRRDFSFGAGDDATPLSRQHLKSSPKEGHHQSSALHKLNQNVKPLSTWQLCIDNEEVQAIPRLEPHGSRGKCSESATPNEEKVPARENSSSSVATVKLRPQRKIELPDGTSQESNQTSDSTAVAAARAATQGPRENLTLKTGGSKP